MAKGEITKRSVDALKTGSALFDSDVSGFFVRARGEAKTYAVKYRANGRQRLYTIGRHGNVTPDQARKIAKQIAGRVAKGEDPQSEKSERRNRAVKTFNDLAGMYLEEHARQHKRPRSIRSDEDILQLHLRPALGTLDVEAIGKMDLYRLRTQLQGKPILFNRARALVSKMFALAQKWGYRKGDNPARLVEKFKENKRGRMLSSLEYARLFDALAAAEGKEHPSVIACVKLLALTGARLSEILTLKWDWVDFQRAALRLPDSKTGAKVIPLAAPALSVLASLPRVSEHVLPGADLNGHFVGIQRPWRRIRAAAAMPDLRLHDLRNGFASIGAASGESLKLLGGVLGHRQASTTERYAHLSQDPLTAAANRIAAKIEAAATSGSGEVIRHPHSKRPDA